MKAAEIKASIEPLKKILCDEDFFYQIPDYQRPYAWHKDQLSDLIDDLWNAHQNNQDEKYFCGSMVLVENQKDGRYDIIDGQQRTTTFIILACVLRDFYKEYLKNKAKRYIHKAIQDEDDESKRKLTLLTDINHQNDFEQSVLKKITVKDDKIKNIEKEYPNNRYLQNAYYLKQLIDEKEITDKNDFVEWMFTKVVLTSIICPNEDTAIQIFNVLNDRGLQLSSVDILKSRLMATLGEEDRKTFKSDWDTINKKLTDNDLSMEGLLNTYLYYAIAPNSKAILHKELIKYFKEGHKDSLHIISDLKDFSDAYIKIIYAQDKYIYCLKYLRHTMFWQSILTTAKFVGYEQIDDLKKLLVSFYYLHWITGATLSRFKQTSLNIIKAIKGKHTLDEIKKELIINNLKSWNIGYRYSEENWFLELEDFEKAYGKAWCKPVLLMLEYFSKDDSNQSFIPLDRKVQVEHILPKNPDISNRDWSDFDEDEKDELVNNLGNLTLLSMRKNIQARNNSFEKKKEAITNKDNVATSFEITRQLFEKYNEWNVTNLKERGEEMLDSLEHIIAIKK